ncbi:hypothetical protein RQP46_010376 [Phenoliferia psychrophenolica]
MQGFNKYYPPDWVPESGSLNAYNGKHALGDRARKLDKGILIVRFELPYNIWCDNCKNHIGQGVRYNAEKSKVGMYYTTPILNFRCKCHLCQHWFEIRTDPANTRYVVHSGARQQNSEWDPAENGGVVLDTPTDPDNPPDAFEALERTETKKVRALSAAGQLHALEELQSARWSDPYAASKALRSSFRKEKTIRVASEGRAEGVRTKYALGDRITKEDLRTPAREVVDEESREWEAAKRERERREAIKMGKRKREGEQVGWREEKRPPPSSSTSTSSRTGKKAPLALTAKSLATKRPSKAVQSLAERVRLNSALKADPFRNGVSVGKLKSRELEGAVVVGKRADGPA